MPPTRFTPELNRLRAALRRHHGPDLLEAVRREIDRLPVATLVADNFQRYIAANAAAERLTGYSQAELGALTVMDLTSLPSNADGQKLWETFIGLGGQRGELDLLGKSGVPTRVRYWAYASVAPGIHVSLMVPVAAAAEPV